MQIIREMYPVRCALPIVKEITYYLVNTMRKRKYIFYMKTGCSNGTKMAIGTGTVRDHYSTYSIINNLHLLYSTCWWPPLLLIVQYTTFNVTQKMKRNMRLVFVSLWGSHTYKRWNICADCMYCIGTICTCNWWPSHPPQGENLFL